MGKGAAAEMKKRKKKGRPSLLDLQKRNLIQQQQQQKEEQQQKKRKHQSPITTSNPNRRSTRRNPATDVTSVDGGNDDRDYDDDDERKEKKVKLVVRLPASNHHHSPQPKASENSLSSNSASQGSDSNADAENHEVSLEKPKINDIGHRSGADQLEKVQKATETQHGSTLDSGPTTPLPDKKLLVFILDRLQKKDTHGVFSEPVDPNELPDYHEIIEHPMDFQTVRKKLDEGHYSNLDEFEADVFLICSNAMQYNAPDTVYFRQARSIQELAKRDFENLRQVNDDGEPQPKIVRRGRPPTKNLKSAFGSPPIERVGPESSSDATLATGGDNVVGSNSYNLRRAPISSRFQSNEALFKTSNQSRNSETYVDWSFDWNSEFPASVLKAEAKYGKKQFSFDENRRATYRQFHPSAFGHASSILTTLNGGIKQLMGVGLHSEHGYARSLSRFAANLGPAVWKIASKKINFVLPAGVEFGPGWIGVNEASPRPASSSPDQKSSNNSVYDGRPFGPITMSVSGTNSVVTYRSSLPCTEPVVEVVPGQTSNSDLAVFRSGVSGINPGPSFQTLQKRVLNADRNGFNGVSWYDHSSQMGSMPPQMVGVVTWSNTTTTPPMTVNRINPELKLPGSSCSAHLENTSAPSSAPDSQTAPEVALTGVQPWQGLPSHRTQYSLPVPPDLNVRFQAPGSPNSNFRIGSPQQPDLALQL